MALRISSDQAAFYGCGFYGAQDTLNDDHGRHYFKDCFIQGSIDFIFGNARSLFEVIQNPPPNIVSLFRSIASFLFPVPKIIGPETKFSFIWMIRAKSEGIIGVHTHFDHDREMETVIKHVFRISFQFICQ